MTCCHASGSPISCSEVARCCSPAVSPICGRVRLPPIRSRAERESPLHAGAPVLASAEQVQIGGGCHKISPDHVHCLGGPEVLETAQEEAPEPGRVAPP